MSNFEHLTDEDILNKILGVEIPKKTVEIKRLGIPVTVHGLSLREVTTSKERHTSVDKKGNSTLDTESYNLSLIVSAIEKPNFGDQRLLAKYKASSAEEVIKRLLLSGEIIGLVDLITDLSGFNSEFEEVKNG